MTDEYTPCYETDFPHLLSPIKIGPLTFKNRMVGAPSSLAEYGEHGFLSRENVAFFEMRAKGGCACVTLGEAIPDMKTGLSHHKQIPLDTDFTLPGLTEAADAIHSHSAYASIELSHGGFRCTTEQLKGHPPIGPSAGVSPNGEAILEMTEDMMFELAEKYAEAAARVKSCGFDMLMIHGAHSWLLHQFSSSLYNHRTDKYGGCLENRLRFPLMVIDAVRNAIGPDMPIEYRMSGSELVDGGYGIETGIEMAKILAEKVDVLNISAGVKGDEFSNVLMHPSFFQPHAANTCYAAEIKKHVNIPVAAVGGLSIPEEMERILAEGQVDLIAMARGVMADPYMPRKLARGQRSEVVSCLRCLECEGSMGLNRTTRCSVNPEIGREYRVFLTPPAKQRRKVLIAGGGPAGMEAAITAADRGHEVVLCEQGDCLGGRLSFAEHMEFKGMVRRYRETMITKVGNRDIKVRLNTPVNAQVFAEEDPDVLIAAVGADAVIPHIPGIENDNVIIGADIDGSEEIGQRVVVIGGGAVGAEWAIQFHKSGHDVVILEMQDELVKECTVMDKVAHQHELEPIESYVNTTCTEITSEGVKAESILGEQMFFPADTVIVAVGMKSRESEVEKLRPLAREFYVVGDCLKARKILNAVREGYEAAIDLA